MIDIDTSKVKQCGNDIIKLSQDLSKLCNDMYDRINNMPTITHEWQGSGAQNYATRVMREKAQAVDLKNQLYRFGNYIISSADNYESAARKNV